MEKYDIYCQGRKIYSSITEEEMMEITQELADQFYQNGTPHPDDIVVEYLGYDIEKIMTLKKSASGTKIIESHPKNTRQGRSKNTKISASSRNCAGKRYRGQGK